MFPMIMSNFNQYKCTNMNYLGTVCLMTCLSHPEDQRSPEVGCQARPRTKSLKTKRWNTCHSIISIRNFKDLVSFTANFNR